MLLSRSNSRPACSVATGCAPVVASGADIDGAGCCCAFRARSRSSSTAATCDITSSRRLSSRASSAFSRGGNVWPSQPRSCSNCLRWLLRIGSKPNTPCVANNPLIRFTCGFVRSPVLPVLGSIDVHPPLPGSVAVPSSKPVVPRAPTLSACPAVSRRRSDPSLPAGSVGSLQSRLRRPHGFLRRSPPGSDVPRNRRDGFVDRNNPNRCAAGSLRSGLQPLQQGKKSSRVSCRYLVLADSVAARRAETDQPGRTTEFQRYKQRSIMRMDGRPRIGSAVVGASHPIISSN